MLVSVVVPVYNVEKYLRRCLQSISEQTYKDIEIILVDDGSTDNSGQICESYACEDARITVLHKENGGLSSARNAGVALCRGEYISFIDSDDWVEPYYIEKLLILCTTYSADIGIIRMKRIGETEAIDDNNITRMEEEILTYDSLQAIKESLYQRRFTCCAPGKLIRNEIVKSVKFPEGRLSEDLATCHLFFDRANRIVYSSAIGYNYLQREQSIMHSFNSKRLDAIEWIIEIEHFCNEKYPEIYPASLSRHFNIAFNLFLEVPSKDLDNSSYLWKHIKETRLNVIRDSEVRKKEKGAACLSYLGPQLTRLLGMQIKKRL